MRKSRVSKVYTFIEKKDDPKLDDSLKYKKVMTQVYVGKLDGSPELNNQNSHLNLPSENERFLANVNE